MILFSDRQRARYFLAPEAKALGEGALELESLSGARVAVDPQAAAAYEVPEAVAKAWAEEQTGALEAFFSSARRELERASEDARAKLSELAGRGGLDERAILSRFGIDPDAPPEELLERLVEVVGRLSREIPEGTRDLQDAAKTLSRLDEAIGGRGGRRGGGGARESRGGARTREILQSIAQDPDADDELREKLGELEALSRDLDRGRGQ